MATKLQQISELSTLLSKQNAVCQKIHSYFDSFHIDKHQRKLNLYKRFSDYEVLGELFRKYQQQILELTFIERSLPMLAHLIAVILNICSTSWDEFMENLIADTKAQEQFLPFLKIINTSKS